ncbi:uncharacterized protein ASPGLDRAFT_84130 [Aspergillus glaucus CBS 516.65]|uniref:Uncharacterized protein n=1 Tax=Aspergillus glaucus CBS 516.65 TaxID=1160497 RepID=A0A1L9VDE4_ASPGL|nr:hypothetical protein ASPGLDRAFT_84130 [Aspergillus glaucus CBS 516.65]OJJ81991.1 hypothetical protein ASPGLDRAFT_84130 [Aspergillus glaucus CBS 516.65]
MLISKSPSAKDSIEDWYKHISKTKSPRKLTRILLSDRPFKDKTNLLVALPVSATEQNTDMRWLESKFEDTGHAQLAQIISYGIFPDGAENWRQTCLLVVFKGPLGHTERIQTGISAHGYAKIMLDVVAVVDEIVDAAKSPTRNNTTTTTTTTICHKWDRGHCTSACCGCYIRSRGRDGRDAKKQTDMEDFPFDIAAYKSLYSKRVYPLAIPVHT